MRNDCHRPSQIIPDDYTYLISYSCGSWAINVNVAREIQANQLQQGRSMFGHIGKCGVCGAGYFHGDLWLHKPTGDLLHVGHECADKYSLCADRQEYARQRAAIVEQRERRKRRVANARAFQGLLRTNDELRAAFIRVARSNDIVRDIARRCAFDFGAPTARQEELVLRIAQRAKERAEEPELPARRIPAKLLVDKRVVVRGRIVGTKMQDSPYGEQLKMLVVVPVDDGACKLWGTVPASLLVTNTQLRGQTVEFTAKVEVSKNDPTFGFVARPSKARFITQN